MSDNEICKGCVTYNYNIRNLSFCKFEPIKGDESCPCVSCLVKSMCRNACEPFNEFFVVFINSDNHMRILDKKSCKSFNFKKSWPYTKSHS